MMVYVCVLCVVVTVFVGMGLMSTYRAWFMSFYVVHALILGAVKSVCYGTNKPMKPVVVIRSKRVRLRLFWSR